MLTTSHRPYGNNSTSLQEIRRIREAGGWVCVSLEIGCMFQSAFLVSDTLK